MANSEHLAKLNEGRAAWNEWRRDNPDVAVDLSFANLSNRNFQGYWFNRVILRIRTLIMRSCWVAIFREAQRDRPISTVPTFARPIFVALN